MTAADEQIRAINALDRRAEAERISRVPGYAGAAAAFVLAGIGAATSVPPVLLYAVFCLLLAGTIALMFLQLRNAQPKRVAVLTARTPSRVIPMWMVGVALLGSLTPLAYAAKPQYTVIAIIICCTAIATLVVALRLTQLPALLQGDDLPAEVFIDDRLRAHRSAAPLLLAVVQPVAFLSQLDQTTNLETAATALAFAVFVCAAAFMLRGLFKTASFSPA
jgi:hypothetical protein